MPGLGAHGGRAGIQKQQQPRAGQLAWAVAKSYRESLFLAKKFLKNPLVYVRLKKVCGLGCITGGKRKWQY